MSCTNPLKAFQIGVTESGKKKLKIVSYNTVWVRDPSTGERIYNSITIPCGRCISCRLSYAKQWAIRCVLESSFYDESYFLTVTYDDEHNPKKLIKSDLQQFIKSLRQKLTRYGFPDIRFFACGEYGSKTLRPHFHLIIFGLHLEDKKFLKLSKTGQNLYTSEFLSSVWHKGFIQIGDCTYKSCGYVARYCLKGISHSMLEDLGLTPEFILMSRRPGLGFRYFDELKDKLYSDDKIYFDFGNFNNCNLPGYFDYLMEKLDPDIVSNIKDVRRLKSEWNNFTEFMNSSLGSELDYLKLKEDVKLDRIRLLQNREF